MTPEQARAVLDLSADATPEQIEARVQEFRGQLEGKIVRAPTAGLKAKYREALEQLLAARELLTRSSAGAALPVLRRPVAEAIEPEPDRSTASALPVQPVTSPAPVVPIASGRRRRIALAVAGLAILVLGGGAALYLQTQTPERRVRNELLAIIRAIPDLAVQREIDPFAAKIEPRMASLGRYEADVAAAFATRVAAIKKARAEHPNGSDEKGLIHLYRAALAGDQAEIAALLARGADPNYSSFPEWYVAVEEMALEFNSFPPWYPIVRDDRPLFAALRTKNIEAAKLLAKHGARFDEVTPAGRNALTAAAISGDLATLRYALAQGAPKHHTALFAAALYGDVAMVRLLLESGLDVNRADSTEPHWGKGTFWDGDPFPENWSEDFTALHYAVCRPKPTRELIEVLLHAGAKVHSGLLWWAEWRRPADDKFPSELRRLLEEAAAKQKKFKS